MKTCTKCGEEKPATIDYFYYRKANPKYGIYEGLESACKPCTAIKHKNRSGRNIKKWIDYIRSVHKIECNRCGFNIWEALEFHHTIPRNGNQDKSIGNKLHIYSPDSKKGDWLREEIKKCELVCANCHRLIHAELI